MKKTTRTIYMKGNSCGSQYAPNNCSGYGTKWRVQLKKDEHLGWKETGHPVLLAANWDIDEEKLRQTENYIDSIQGGVLY